MGEVKEVKEVKEVVNEVTDTQAHPTLREQLTSLNLYGQAIINDITILCGGKEFNDPVRKGLVEKEIGKTEELLKSLKSFINTLDKV